MDRELIAEKLESLRRCVRRVSEKRPSSVEKLFDDFDLQDILALNLSRAVQLCVDIGAHLIGARAVDSKLGERRNDSELAPAVFQNGDVLSIGGRRALGVRDLLELQQVIFRSDATTDLRKPARCTIIQASQAAAWKHRSRGR